MKESVRSLNIVCKLINQCCCPDSVHVLFISMEFLADNCRCELKAKLACQCWKAEFLAHCSRERCYCLCEHLLLYLFLALLARIQIIQHGMASK